MASWKKVIVSGSNAELCSLTVKGTGGTIQNITDSIATTTLTGSFSGSFTGDGKQLFNVTGSKVVTANNTTATVARITFTGADIGTQALCSNTSLTYDATSNIIGASISGNAATATSATTATCATNINLTTSGDAGGTHYISFFPSASGYYQAVTDGQLTYNPTSNTLSVTNISGTVSNATNATCIKLTETDTDAAYNLVFATSGSYADARIDNQLTYNASTNLLTTAGAINAGGAVCSAGTVSAGNGTTAGTFSSNGDTNVILKTGNGTSGNITIIDGANGNISITPNGSGQINIGGDNPTIFNSQGATQALCIEGGVSGVCVKDAGGLTVECSLNVGGDLIVSGDFTYLNVTNLAVEDRFILLNSGSAGDDYAGIVVDEGAPSGSGHALVYSGGRWGFTASLASNATSVTPDAFAAAVVTSDIAEYQKVGNIRLNGEDIYIYS